MKKDQLTRISSTFPTWFLTGLSWELPAIRIPRQPTKTTFQRIYYAAMCRKARLRWRWLREEFLPERRDLLPGVGLSSLLFIINHLRSSYLLPAILKKKKQLFLPHLFLSQFFCIFSYQLKIIKKCWFLNAFLQSHFSKSLLCSFRCEVSRTSRSTVMNRMYKKINDTLC